MINPINIIVWCAVIFLVVIIIRFIIKKHKETKRAKNHADWLAGTGRYRKNR